MTALTPAEIERVRAIANWAVKAEGNPPDGALKMLAETVLSLLAERELRAVAEEKPEPAEEVWYLATCDQCVPRLPQPFHDEGERNAWARAHGSGTGHHVTVSEKAAV